MLCIFVTRRSEAQAEAVFVEKTRMATDRIPMLFFFLLIPFQFYHAFHSASALPLLEIAPPSQATLSLLKDVLKDISASENWNLKAVRISELDAGEARYGTSQIYEFSIELGKSHFGTINFQDEFVSWRKFRKPKSDLYPVIHGVNSLAVLDTLEIEGPLELRVDPPHQLSLSLPLNISHAGLKRVLVREGIALKVRGALEVSFRYSSDFDLRIDEISMTFDEYESDYRPFLLSTSCTQVVQVRISGGSASLAAHVERNPDWRIETVSIPHDGILLLPDKGLRSAGKYRNGSSCPHDDLSMRLSIAEKLWRSLVGPELLQKDPIVSVAFQANRKASAEIKIPIAVEREVLRHYIYEWRYKSHRERRRIEWVRLEVEATVDADEKLKLLYYEKKSRPILYWQDIVSNKSSPTLNLARLLNSYHFYNLL